MYINGSANTTSICEKWRVYIDLSFSFIVERDFVEIRSIIIIWSSSIYSIQSANNI